MLLKSAKILGKDNVRNGFYGQEINLTTYNLCRINMFLHDIDYDKFDIACEDTLVSPQHWDDEPFEVIVSNPPYITEKEMQELENQVKKEPELALYGGVDGLDFYKKITENAKEYLKKEGLLIFEIGYKQKEDVSKILIENKFKNIKCVKDLQGLDRVIIGEKEEICLFQQN